MYPCIINNFNVTFSARAAHLEVASKRRSSQNDRPILHAPWEQSTTSHTVPRGGVRSQYEKRFTYGPITNNNTKFSNPELQSTDNNDNKSPFINTNHRSTTDIRTTTNYNYCSLYF
ncbi:unnamed protein product [Caenorhabditis angaria]|uniref:Uncharacterized protein n=1 Tax=Caenorhabditis angaria TaxID=860376 RepID=A0A9P1IC27_9PELO|nr:unnamed protein product [Caenorhabditis angaria]